MMDLNYHDWTIRFCNDNYCWGRDRRIDVDLSYNGDPRQIILHEIAHINTAKYCNQKHTPAYWKHLTLLTRKYLKRDIDDNQKKHQKYMTDGYYALHYGPKKLKCVDKSHL